MPEPSPSGFISLLWRLSLAVLAAALVLNFAVNTLRCAWPWIVGVGVVVAVVALIIWRVRGRGNHW
ncbi:MAG: hypothetical protein FWF02_07910 [Micrococcales bacterium]|nr:hypothetical protein [Micrococcales bacterium]MCL2667615.1 hypothetical protein [Micrococcales bacterium]